MSITMTMTMSMSQSMSWEVFAKQMVGAFSNRVRTAFSWVKSRTAPVSDIAIDIDIVREIDIVIVGFAAVELPEIPCKVITDGSILSASLRGP